MPSTTQPSITLEPPSLGAMLAEVTTAYQKEQRKAAYSAALAAQRMPSPSLATFVERTSSLILEPWQHIICDRLQALSGQTGQRLLVHGPRQFGKSIPISQRFPAYTIGVNPGYRLRVACNNVSHAQRFSRVNLDLMRAPEYREMFPNPQARVPAVASIEEWSTVARAAKRAANPSFKPLGLGTGFVGLGVDTLIIDEPYKDRMEARSEATNAMLWGWWTDTVLPRFNPDTNVVVMFHRWWEGDFAGRLLERGGWEVLRFPAIADGGADDPTGREVGEPLSPRYSLDYLAAMRVEQGTSFEALYQGVPYPASGGMFKREWWQEYDPALWIRYSARKIIQIWDTAFKTKQENDYSVCSTWTAMPDGLYVLDVWRDKVEFPVLKREAQSQYAKWRPIAVYIEDKASGQSLIQSLQAETGIPLIPVPVEADKVSRASAVTPYVEARRVFLPTGAAWVSDWIDEHARFPLALHDDQVDTTSMALRLLALEMDLQPMDSATA